MYGHTHFIRQVDDRFWFSHFPKPTRKPHADRLRGHFALGFVMGGRFHAHHEAQIRPISALLWAILYKSAHRSEQFDSYAFYQDFFGSGVCPAGFAGFAGELGVDEGGVEAGGNASKRSAGFCGNAVNE